MVSINVFVGLLYTSIIVFMFLLISLENKQNLSIFVNKLDINQMFLKPLSQPLASNNGNIVNSDVIEKITVINETILFTNETNYEKSKNSNLESCPLIPEGLMGPIEVMSNSISFEKIEEKLPELEPGGRYRPNNCMARHKVAIIIPYRDREEHLKIFLLNIHPMLKRQQLDYGIFVIEQFGNEKFNRAKLMNIGFLEALKHYDYQCFIFHNVDLIPEDDRNLYSCPEQPRHMSVAIDRLKYILSYPELFSGVTAFTKQQFERVNGFSNQFMGSGGEDDDMSYRITYYGYKISRYQTQIARYKMIDHEKAKPDPKRNQIEYSGKIRYKTDGINSVKYERIDTVFKKLYTWILVDI